MLRIVPPTGLTGTFSRLCAVLDAGAWNAGIDSFGRGRPVPDRGVTRSPPAEAATVTPALFAPDDVGRKRTRTVQVAPPASAVPGPQSAASPLRRWNWFAFVPLIPTAESDSGSVPEFVSLSSCARVAPADTLREPKSSAPGLRVSSVWMPEPSSGMFTAAAFELTVAVPVREPVDVGSKVMRSLQVCPAASTVEGPQSSPLPVA